MTDISKEAVGHLCEIHRGYLQHGTVATLQALRAALDDAEAECDAANALLREAREWLSCVEGYLRDGPQFLADAARIDAHLGAKP